MTSDKKLLWIYETMLKIRYLENEMVRRWPEQEMRSPPHLSTGREAIAAGVCAALKTKDQIMGYYRGHAYYIAKGGNPKEFIAEMYCKITGSNAGKGGSMLISFPKTGYMGSSAIVASGIPIATGLALANKMKKNKKVVVCFFGEAATEEGVFYESLNFAALHKLPIVYVCENDSFAVTTLIYKRQAKPNNICIHVKSFGIPAIKIDGNNPLTVHQMTEKAVEHVRSKKGPYFIEAVTYRWREHVGEKMDDFTPGRSKKELTKWLKKDPIKFLEKYLIEKKVLIPKNNDHLISSINKMVKDSFSFGIKSPLPKKVDLLTDVYQTNHKLTKL